MSTGNGSLYLLLVQSAGKTTLMHELAKSLFKGQQVMSIEDPVEIAGEVAHENEPRLKVPSCLRYMTS